jgi:transposase-like protein
MWRKNLLMNIILTDLHCPKCGDQAVKRYGKRDEYYCEHCEQNFSYAEHD